jgi:hypothetical protein
MMRGGGSGNGSERGQRTRTKGAKGGTDYMGTKMKNQEEAESMNRKKPGRVGTGMMTRRGEGQVGLNAAMVTANMRERIAAIEGGGGGRKQRPLPKLRTRNQPIVVNIRGSLDAIVEAQSEDDTKITVQVRNTGAKRARPGIPPKGQPRTTESTMGQNEVPHADVAIPIRSARHQLALVQGTLLKIHARAQDMLIGKGTIR